MNRRLFPAVFLIFVCSVLAFAQLPNPPGPAGGPPVPPIRIVARFFEFTPEQVEQIKGLLEIRQTATEPLAKQIAEKEAELRELMASAKPDPGAVGNLVIGIHQLREQMGEAREQFEKDFESILTEEQKHKLAAVRRAERLEPVFRAMRDLRLLP
jgi:Spy/CpxP family protein refolding chaperone